MKKKVFITMFLSLIGIMLFGLSGTVSAETCGSCGKSVKVKTHEGVRYPDTSCQYYRCSCGYTDGWSHRWNVTTTPATCTTAETTSYSCSRNISYHQYSVTSGSALGHNYGSWYTVTSATCTSAGTKRRNCTRSGCSSYETDTISALGHSYGSWYTVTSATCTSAGTKRRNCTRSGCSSYETDTIPATGHTTPSSYSTTSTQHYKNCTSCSTRLTTGNHVDSDSNGYCDVCNYTMTFTISYNANGGSGAPSAQTKYPGTDLTLSTTVPTRESYQFKGWATSSSATTATYQPGDTYTTEASVTLYAVWELIQLEPVLSTTSYTYDGTAKTPTVTVTYKGTALTLNTDYTLTYSNNTNAGTASVIVSGKNTYAGQEVSKTFTINKRSLTITPTSSLKKEYKDTDPTLTYAYSGQVSGQTPKFSGVLARATGENIGTYAIKKGTLSLANNGSFLASNYNLVLSSTTVNFTITQKSVTSLFVQLSKNYFKYDETAKEPEITVTHGSYVLVENTDYTKTYSNNTNLGTAKVTITGKGNYTGTKIAEFYITEDGAQFDQIVIDTTAPTISNIKIANDDYTVTITATIVDPNVTSEIEGIGVDTSATRYAVTQTNTRPATGSSEWKTSNNITVSFYGTGYVWILAKDALGNTRVVSSTTNIVVKNYKDASNNYYSTLADAFSGATTGSTITALRDITDNAAATLTSKIMTLDLNGKTITKTVKGITIANTSKLTITDNAGTAGKIVSTAGAIPSLITNRGNLTVLKGTISCSVTSAIYSIGTLTLGTLGGGVSTTVPTIQGGRYGVNALNGFNFYDGILKGTTAAYSGDISDYEPQYGTVEGTEGSYKTVTLTIVDLTAPTGTISLGGTNYASGDKEYVGSTTITVSLTANDNISAQANIKVALINEKDYDKSKPNSGITWQDFSTTKTWQTSSGDGKKRVYVIFKDEAGNQSVYFAE